ncbi:hypothetical protein SeLEV6574_g02561 [Synchytrium endobioticum]|nr:hypothetical protein SeLEV6574_g02561 [Synchytrium endobioticum]
MKIEDVEAEIKALNKENEDVSNNVPEEGGPVDSEGFQLLISDGTLKKKILRKGEGEPFSEGTFVTVHYVGTLQDGTVFDSSRKRNKPFEFKIGKGQVILGWDIGVATMKSKEVAILVCGPALAYGEKGSPPHIKPNATLYFEVEILSATPPQDPIFQRIAEAMSTKEKANNVYSKQEYEAAISLYEKALQRIEYSWGALPGEETEIRKLRIQLYSNLAAARLHNKQYKDCIVACEAVLEMDSTNVKAAFRLAKAKKALFAYDDAIKYLELAARVEQNDPAIRNEITQTKREQLAFKQKEKHMYAAMFESKSASTSLNK